MRKIEWLENTLENRKLHSGQYVMFLQNLDGVLNYISSKIEKPEETVIVISLPRIYGGQTEIDKTKQCMRSVFANSFSHFCSMNEWIDKNSESVYAYQS